MFTFEWLDKNIPTRISSYDGGMEMLEQKQKETPDLKILNISIEKQLKQNHQPDYRAIEILKNWQKKYKTFIILLSEEKNLKNVEKWLKNHDVPYDAIATKPL